MISFKTAPHVCFVLSLYLFGCVVGCSEKGGPTVPVSGQVTMEGKPFSEKAIIFFFSEDLGKGESADLGGSGEFSIPNLEIGSYSVWVQSNQDPIPKKEADYTPEEAEMMAQLPPEDRVVYATSLQTPPVSGIPGKYQKKESSTLTAEVKQEGENTFPFDLKP